MKSFIYKKKSFLYIFLILLFSCNYKPLFDEDQLNQLRFKNIEINGEKRIVQLVVNKLNVKKDPKGHLTLYVNGKKNVSISNKSVTGKVLEYSVTLSYQVDIKNNSNGEKLYSKKITNTENYKPSSIYSDTIRNQKKIIENIANLIAKQISNEISLILRNDI
tara:strand:- start:55 stop:540 length:486 start_codon:yes stop_codon:yes gene_type:complete